MNTFRSIFAESYSTGNLIFQPFSIVIHTLHYTNSLAAFNDQGSPASKHFWMKTAYSAKIGTPTKNNNKVASGFCIH